MQYGIPYRLVTTEGTLWFNQYANNPYLHMRKVAGLDFPGVRSEKVARPGRAGVTRMGGTADAIFPTLEGWIVADSPASTALQEQELRSLCRAAYENPATLIWTPAALAERQCTVYVDEKPDIGDDDGVPFYMIPLVSEDPVAYGTALKTQNTSIVAAGGGGGLIFPFDFPMNFADPSGNGAGNFTNAGDLPSFPVVRIHGDITNPVVHNETTGLRVALTESGLSIPSGQYVEIDMLHETIYLNGDTSAPLYDALDVEVSMFWSLEKNINIVRVSGDSPSGAYGELIWRDAYA
jgi:hypothetical protein